MLKLKEMLQMQKELNDTVVKNFGLEGKDRGLTIKLALLQEVGELLQECESCFKDWKAPEKCRNDRQKQWEEWSDCLHFALSFLLYNYNDDIDHIMMNPYMRDDVLERNLEDLDCFHTDSKFEYMYEDIVNNDVYSVMISLMGIARDLGMSYEAMNLVYFSKHEMNHKRQDGTIEGWR